MQGLVLQLTRVGFLLLLWLFIWSVLRILRTDIYAPTGGAVMVRRGLALRGGSLLPNRQRLHIARHMIVTEGALAGTRITLGSQPVLIGRADDSTWCSPTTTHRHGMPGCPPHGARNGTSRT